MDVQEFLRLAAKAQRQRAELGALDAQIGREAPLVAPLQAAVDTAAAGVATAQAALDAAQEDTQASAESELRNAKEAHQQALIALAGPKGELDILQGNADAIRSAVAQCQLLMDESGLTFSDAELAQAMQGEAATLMEGRIKAERDRRQTDGGVQEGGKWFLSNDREAGRYNSIITVAAAMGATGTTVIRAAWRTMEAGVTQDMTPNLARGILAGGFTQFAAIDDAAQRHITAMRASADPLAYDYSGGWPPIFGESAP